ncbi:hypothetical protein GH714_038711 [Hevea brasiliensis]|uniref:HECT-type E3 ubiquitin transferase n=1 Tax=Hevea brasiliensis TaxID=3981 RepID=A0A6A6KPE9_HEVBR|nr:hypothetical protein GH714_038711 [Hevea brasiliensis]
MWTYQSKKLISLCSFLLAKCDKSLAGGQDVVVLTSLAMRFLVVLTDLKGWKSITDNSLKDANVAVNDLIRFMGSCESGLYISIRIYINKLDIPFSSQTKTMVHIDDSFLITATAVTLALRPFHATDFLSTGFDLLDKHSAAVQYCLFLLTIPRLTQRLPAVLVSALKHNSILSPWLQTLLHSLKVIPPVGWALANIICLATGSENDFLDPGGLNQSLDYAFYVHVVIILAESLLSWLDDSGWTEKENQFPQVNSETSAEPVGKVSYENETTCALKMSYVDLLRPVCQQWHLTKLLAISKTDAYVHTDEALTVQNPKYLRKLELLDIAYFYSYILRIFVILNPMLGPLPVLNMLSFTPGYLVTLWEEMESLLFPRKGIISADHDFFSGNKKDGVGDKKQMQLNKEGSNKWANMLYKITGKSQADVDYTDSADGQPSAQVPFKLEQQRRIASVLNTLVYNGLAHGTVLLNRPLMDSAIRCLHLMYEKDCRRQFCPPVLWLSSARKSRPPIAVAARTHEIVLSNATYSVITTTPHVYPFEERVQMFREFINMDKVSRKMAGEVTGPGSRAVDIVVRRGHIVEDGFRQLNTLGSRLQSSIHVSFVSECGASEAGLDYGGLSKEFLTDISKAAFSPEYGLFSQTSTSDRFLIPNPTPRYLENAVGRYSFLDELSTLDPELYRNLMYVKHYDGDLKDLSLDFTVTEESFGKHHVIELKPGGKDVCVTSENKMQYDHAMADYKLNRQILPYSNAFYSGLTDLISHPG